MTDAALSALVLGIALALFVSERVRHDLVALFALLACLVFGLVTPAAALEGFADPAVIAVAAILVVGRAIELSGMAAGIARVAIPERAPFTVRMAALLGVGALLSAFINNIAALVITMPVAAEIARSARKPAAATLMPLAFATILRGMTTLIGTPANLILSSVRQEELGAPFGFFTMTPVGAAVALIGLLYLALLGWRLLPIRQSEAQRARPPWRVFELAVPDALGGQPAANLAAALRAGAARTLALFRHEERVALTADSRLEPGDHLLIVSRENRWAVAERSGLQTLMDEDRAPGRVTARVVVAHGSLLIGQGYDAVPLRSGGQLRVVAAGPRAARQKLPLAQLRIEAGDQLYLRGPASDLAPFLATARLLEIDRFDPVPIAPGRAAVTVALFLLAVAAVVFGGVSPR